MVVAEGVPKLTQPNQRIGELCERPALIELKGIVWSSAKESVISTQVHNSTWDVERTSVIPSSIRNWLARRRVAISLIGFTSLVVFNVFIKQTIPFNPINLANPWVLSALALLLVGLAIRSWSAGTLNKSRELTTTGPYAVVRNPLYVGSFMMMFAFCILCKDLPTFLFIAGPMTFLYWVQVQFEEIRLSKLFPDQWSSYYASTPRFIPWRLWRASLVGWSKMEWLRNREYRAVGATAFGIAAIYGWHAFRTWQNT